MRRRGHRPEPMPPGPLPVARGARRTNAGRRVLRLALLGAFAVVGSACAAFWGFADFQSSSGADASDETSSVSDDAQVDVVPDATVSTLDATAPIDAGALDAGGPDVADAREAGDGGTVHDAAADAGDAGDGAEAGSLVCGAGFHDCSDACSSDFSPNSCGATSCSPCEFPLNGLTVVCNGVACVGSCSSTLTLCDGGTATGTCVDTTSDPSHCGGCGTRCPAPSGIGMATCSGSPPSCGIACDGGQTACPDTSPTACVDISRDIRNCGACGNVCTAQDGGDAGAGVCVDGGCQ